MRKGVSKNPAERYQSAAEMIERLARRAEGDFPVQCPMTFMKTVSHFGSRVVDRHPLLMALGAVATLAVFVAGVVSLVRHGG